MFIQQYDASFVGVVAPHVGKVVLHDILLVVVGDATVAVVQHGFVGKMVFTSMTNMVGWVMLYPWQVTGQAG